MCMPAAFYLLLLLSSCSVRAKSNFTPLNIILNTCTTYPCLLEQFYEAQSGMMLHRNSEDKYISDFFDGQIMYDFFFFGKQHKVVRFPHLGHLTAVGVGSEFYS